MLFIITNCYLINIKCNCQPFTSRSIFRIDHLLCIKAKNKAKPH